MRRDRRTITFAPSAIQLPASGAGASNEDPQNSQVVVGMTRSGKPGNRAHRTEPSTQRQSRYLSPPTPPPPPQQYPPLQPTVMSNAQVSGSAHATKHGVP